MSKQYLDMYGLSVYDEEMKQYTGALEDLETQNKSSLVDAINEAFRSGIKHLQVDNGNLIFS